jgi:hypothetical protein
VFSLQARRERFQVLDLIPPEYTFQATSAAVLAAQPPPNSSAPAQPSSSARPTNVKASNLPAGTKRGGTSSSQAKGRRVRPRRPDTEVKQPSLAECRRRRHMCSQAGAYLVCCADNTYSTKQSSELPLSPCPLFHATFNLALRMCSMAGPHKQRSDSSCCCKPPMAKEGHTSTRPSC